MQSVINIPSCEHETFTYDYEPVGAEAFSDSHAFHYELKLEKFQPLHHSATGYKIKLEKASPNKSQYSHSQHEYFWCSRGSNKQLKSRTPLL